MAQSKRNFFILFDMDGSTSKGRSGWNVGRGPKKVSKTTGVDMGCMSGRLCYRSDAEDNAYVDVDTDVEVQDDKTVKLTMTLYIPPGAILDERSDGSLTVEIVSTYTP